MSINKPSTLAVVSSKLHMPPAPSDLVCRERLHDLLLQNPKRSFTLVSAPAGSGKSTLVAHWLRKSTIKSAWFSIEDSDNDIRQFLNYVISAIRTHFKDGCRGTLELLQAPELPPLTTLRKQLSNELDELSEPLFLVLDDFHRINRVEIHEIINHLLDFPPSSLHLVIVTRHDPPVQLTKLRADGRVVDIRERNLRFTQRETHLLLKQVGGIAVTDKLLTHVDSVLEGWVVGLRLVCLALRDHPNPENFLCSLSGGTQTMQDYLFQEVLTLQSDDFRYNLLSMSILDRFCIPLCAAVCKFQGGYDSSKRFVAQLKDANLFVIELDSEGEWFRFHHLFQRLLLNRLEQQAGSEEIANLHLRASVWFESQGMVEESLKHAMAANDLDRAASLLELFREEALKTDRWYVILKWLAVLPEEILQRYPELLLVRAWMYVHQFHYSKVIQVLDRLDVVLFGDDKLQHLSGEIASLRGMALHRLGDSLNGLKYLELALALIPESSVETRAQTEVSFCLACQQDGSKDRAIEYLDSVMNRSNTPQGVRKSRLEQVYIFLHIISGHLTKAEIANQPPAALVESQDVYGDAFRAYLQGIIHLHRYEPEAALNSLDYFRCTNSRRYIQFKRAAIDSMTCLMLSCELLGRTAEVETVKQMLCEFVASMGDYRFSILVNSALARMDVLHGKTNTSIRWAETAEFPFDTTMLWFLDTPWITACRVRITQGSITSLMRAEKDLHQLVKLSKAHHNDIKLTENLSLLAVACYLQGKTDLARQHLDQALTLARVGGVVLPFVEWSPKVAEVMLEMLPTDSDWLIAEIHQVLTSRQHARQSAQPAVDLLTNRQSDVLGFLSKRFSDKEIAAELGISIETVKTHVKHIRRKLCVTNRREAVAKALELGLTQD